jgi:hypothetical protein
MSDESTTQQVQGFCEGEMTRGDWSEFHINIGRQYPVKLATKREEVKQAARAAGNQQAVWTYNETQGNPNPHRPGEFFKNRYLEAVEVGGQVTIAPQQSGAAPGGPPPSTRPAETNRSIERQTIVKAMVPIFGAVKNDGTLLFPDPNYWWGMLYKLDDFMVNGRPAEVPEQVDESTYVPTAPVEDDDSIPF